MDEERVASWVEVQEALFADAWDEQLGRFRASTAFRGRGDAAEPLATSLQRLGGDYAAVERHLLRNFRKYASGAPPADGSTWAWLALAKHHGLPTRLLDWTLSPLVALHFATADPLLRERDGAVWCVDYALAHRELPRHLGSLLEGEGGDLFTTELLARAATGLDELGAGGGDFLLFLEPPALDARIVNQYAVFLAPRQSARRRRRVARRPAGAGAASRRARRAQGRGARQARPGERDGARALPRPGRSRRVAAALLPARPGGVNRREPPRRRMNAAAGTAPLDRETHRGSGTCAVPAAGRDCVP